MEEYCNGCGNVICNMVKSSNGDKFNWYCEVNSTDWRALEISAPKGTMVVKPYWCPKANKNTGESTTRSSAPSSPITPNAALANVKPMTPWDEIKVNQIYHIPPMFNLERQDILIKSITKASLNYVVLEKNKPVTHNAQRVLYPTMQLAKFLVPHKNLKVEIVSQSQTY